jgi:small subunit ribosomal protein S14
MATTAKIAANDRRKEVVKLYRKRREELKKLTRDLELTQAERQQATFELSKLPRDASPTRVRNRCILTGRPRGYYRKFGLSRIALRDLARRGELPGDVKASW